MEEIKKFKKDTQSVSLGASEKNRLRAEMKFFVQNNPAQTSGVLSPYFRHIKPFAYAFSIVLLVGITTFSAEAALPGELLYPVKINVNENVIKAIAVSNEAKARINVSLTKRRLDETVHLIAEGRAEKEHVDEIQKKIETYNDNIVQFIDSSETSSDSTDAVDAIEIASEMEAVLSAHQKIFDAAEDTAMTTPEIEALGDTMENYQEQIQTQLEASDVSDKIEEIDPESLKTEAEENLNEATEALESISASGTPVAAEQIQSLQQMIDSHREMIESGQYNEAFLGLEKTEQLIDEIGIILETQKVLEENVTE